MLIQCITFQSNSPHVCLGHAPGSDFAVLGLPRGSNIYFFQTWSFGISYRRGWRAEKNASKFFILASNWWPWGEVKRSNIKFQLPCQFQRILYQTLFVFSQITDRKHIEYKFYSVAGVMHQGWDLGCWGSKTLAWGFAMAPHRLRILVTFFFKYNSKNTTLEWTSDIL